MNRALFTPEFMLFRLLYDASKPEDISALRWRGMCGWYKARVRHRDLNRALADDETVPSDN